MSFVSTINHRFIVIILGRPGSGKGTQGKKISDQYKLPHISIGDLYRKEVREITRLGELIIAHHKSHPTEFPPNELAYGLLAARLSKEDCQSGFVLDGFPRTVEQIAVLIHFFIRPYDIWVAIHLDMEEEIIKKRLTNRFICSMCEHQFGTFDGKRKGEKCLILGCSGQLQHRKEDIDPDLLQRRFDFFNHTITSILQNLPNSKLCTIKVNAKDSPEDVFKKITNYILTPTDKRQVTPSSK